MPSVSVLICAHNEQRSLGALLSDILCSRLGGGLSLDDILVVADGCTDGTIGIVQEYAMRDPRVRLQIIGPPNVGKSEAFNRAVTGLTADILVMFDADVRLADEYVLDRLAVAVHRGAVLASGNDVPSFPSGAARTMGERAANGRYLIKQSLKQALGPSCVFACVGRAMAMAPAMYRTRVPDLPEEDNFRFFTTRARDWKFTYVPEAVVRFRPPATVRDYCGQHARFWHAVVAMGSLFGPIASYGSPILHWRVTAALTVKYPSTMLSWFLLAALGQSRFLIERYLLRMRPNGIWEPALSTK